MKNNQTIDRIQAIWNMVGGDEVVDTLIGGRAKLRVDLVKILNWIGTTTTSATTERFVAKEKFVKDSKEVEFYRIWDNFTNWFLADDGKIEEPINKQTLRHGNLTKGSIDGPIIEELGGETKAETTLTELWDMLKKQPKGEDGDLLTNSYANIFYIKDTEGVLRAVFVDWHGVGWFVDADSVEYSNEWAPGSRVFCCNS